MYDMDFTDSTTCLVDHELTCSENESAEHGAYYNSGTVPMEDAWDSNSSSSTDWPSSSTDSPVHLDSFSPPQPPSSPSSPDCSHCRKLQLQQIRQQHHHHHHHQGPQRWQNSSPEEVTFSQSDVDEMLDYQQNLKQQQYQQQRGRQQQPCWQVQQQQQRQQQKQQRQQQHHWQEQQQQQERQQQQRQHSPRQAGAETSGYGGGPAEVMLFHSVQGLWDSLAYITSLTDMCDVVFHVGETRQPVYGVKSLLSVRSRVMYLTILQAQKSTSVPSKNGWRRLRPRVDDNVTKDSRIHVDVIDYDVKVFSQLIGFLHSGRVKVGTDTVIGLYCAAAEYEVADLRIACWDFVERCVERNQTRSVLVSGRSYLGMKCLDKLKCQFFKT